MKLGFIGAGRVGSISAFTCIQHMDIDEIVLIDIAEDLAIGEAMDLTHAAAALNKYPKIVGGSDYSLLRGCDMVVVTAGLARKPGMSRLDLAAKNAEIIRDIAKKLIQYAPESKVLVVTNPVDVMTYIMWKESGKPRNEVFGMGSLLDTSRLKVVLKEKIENVFIMGEHGDSMFLPKTIADLNFNKAVEEIKSVATKIIEKKGATTFGPAVCVYRMIKAVIMDTKEELPVSAVLQGEYGIEDVAMGVPVILGKNGIEKIVEYKWSEEDINALKRSAEIIKEKLKELGY
ncbi:MAG TPA: malate dehydrogenase [Archaeoglobus profundus]|nr:malate dehydrogenase [Archaeoglobus profundus]